jgi:hypothetical protein
MAEVLPIEPSFEIVGENLLIKVPIAQLAAVAEADDYWPVRVRDATQMAEYLIRHLRDGDNEDDISELLERAVGHILEPASYLGEGLLSQLDDTSILIDRLWNDQRPVRTWYDGKDLGKTVRECVKEAIKYARDGNRDEAMEWLRRGAWERSEPLAESLTRNSAEALEYAIERYGTDAGG